MTEQRVCDLVKDCNDGTDEAAALCSTRKGNCDFSVNWCGWFNYWADDFNWLRADGIGTPGTGMRLSSDQTLLIKIEANTVEPLYNEVLGIISK